MDEKLDDNNIARVIEYLSTKGATKKTACEMLCIRYNTTRLDKLINTYLEKKAFETKKKAEKRGKPATLDEEKYVVTSYLEGVPVDSIAKALYRSPTFVLGIVEKLNVPKRKTRHSYFRPGLVPEEAMKESFAEGEFVFSMRYNSVAKVFGIYKGAYRIFLLHDSQKQFAYQPAEELCSLEHLRPYLGNSYS